MHILDKDKVRKFCRMKGYRSLGELCLGLGIHRNTLSHFFSPHHSVFPSSVEKLAKALQVSPTELIRSVEVSRLSSAVDEEALSELVDQLHSQFSDLTFVLFGSRARKTHRHYSDFDLGVFSSSGIAHERFRKLRMLLRDLTETSPYMFDLTNLNGADPDFLKAISRDWVFLAGRRMDWLQLLRKVSHEK